jgi:hypothetical protein
MDDNINHLVSDMSSLLDETTKNNKFDLTNQLLDDEPIVPSEITSDYVVICVPLIYVNVDERNGIDQMIPNLRAIKYDKLVDLMQIAIQIPTLQTKQQIELASDLIKRVTDIYSIKTKNSNTPPSPPKNINTTQPTTFNRINEDCTLNKNNTPSTNNTYKSMDVGVNEEEGLDYMKLDKVVGLMSYILKFYEETNLDGDYVNVDSKAISFDKIRRYHVNPNNGILESCEDVSTADGYELYSQIENPEDHKRIREMTNDTDFNRIQYVLSCLEQFLLFRPGYILNTTIQVINLAYLYSLIYLSSLPIKSSCSNDLKGNIIGYVIDVILRSRVINHWQRNPNSAKLLSDLTANYNKDHIIVKMCRLDSARERAKLIISLFSKHSKQLIEQLNYDKYIELLKENAQTIEKEQYYVFNIQTVYSLIKIVDAGKLKQLLQRTTKYGLNNDGTFMNDENECEDDEMN